MVQRRYHMIDLLEQEEIWQPADEEPTHITNLDDDHLVNLKAFFLRNAHKIHSGVVSSMYSFASTLGGEMAQDAMMSKSAALKRKNPLLWMEERPLYRAICREINKRQGIQTCRVMEE